MSSDVSERIGGFQVIRRLATGQTSEVLLARADGPFGFERPVVLKRLLPNYRDDPAFGRMFAREATAYARLTHPAIVKLFDFFADEGQLVMVLEYVDGLSLDRLITMLASNAQHLDDRAALFVGWRIFTALAAAHAATDPVTEAPAPVVHRDVNPSNVLVPWDGHVKLGDFGVARVAGMGGDTQLGLVTGTFGYLAPEQVRGETVTTAADIYAASLVVWELLAQRRAFRRGSLPDVELLRVMAEPEIPSLDVLRADLDPSLRRALARGLSRNPADRTIGAEEMASIIRVSGRLEEGREVLVQAAARARRGAGSSSRSFPALLDTDSITQAVAALRTHSPESGQLAVSDPKLAETQDARTFFPGSATKVRSSPASGGGPGGGRVSRPTPPNVPTTTPSRGVPRSSPISSQRPSRPDGIPTSERSGPVVTSLIGWNETAVPFEHASHEIIPETLRGDLPPPTAPLTGRSAHASTDPNDFEPAPTARRVSDSLDVHQAPTAVLPPAFGMIAENPSQPDLNLATPHMESPEADLLRPPIAPVPVINASSPPPIESYPPIPLAVPRAPAHASPNLMLDQAHEASVRLWKRVAIGAPVAALVVVVALFGWSHWMHGDAAAGTVTDAVIRPGKGPPSDPSSVATAVNEEPSGGLTTGTASATPATTTATAAMTAVAMTGSPAAAAPTVSAPATTRPAAAETPATPAATGAAPATATPASASPAAVAASPVPAGVATIRTADKLGGHRVFVDGKVVGNSPGPLSAPCGVHRVRIGSSGAEVEKNLACGAETMIP